MSTITEDQIRERAHRIWMEEGSPHGRDVEHWEMAKRELELEAAQGGSTATSSDLDKALADSFPASDPIAFTPVAGVGTAEDDEPAALVKAKFAGTR
jgi:hypothetical protein